MKSFLKLFIFLSLFVGQTQSMQVIGFDEHADQLKMLGHKWADEFVIGKLKSNDFDEFIKAIDLQFMIGTENINLSSSTDKFLISYSQNRVILLQKKLDKIINNNAQVNKIFDELKKFIEDNKEPGNQFETTYEMLITGQISQYLTLMGNSETKSEKKSESGK